MLVRLRKMLTVKLWLIMLLSSLIPASFLALPMFDMRINTSSSMPIGIYQYVKTPIGRGSLVSFNLNSTWEKLGFERNYLHSKHLLKVVVGLEGDCINVSNNKIKLNGLVIPNSTIFKTDRKNRVLDSVLQNGVIPKGKALVLTPKENSFDSRYFGLVPMASLKSVKLILNFGGFMHQFQNEKFEELLSGAKAVEYQALAYEIGIPVDPELADFMGACEEQAISPEDMEVDDGA